MESAGTLNDRVSFDTNDQDCTWGARGKKSPDLSFRPIELRAPPGKFQVRRQADEHYPTIVVEIAYRNESWRRLVNDAGRKAFARETSIQIVLSIKIFKNDFCRFWARRHAQGYGMTIVQQTTKLPLNTPTNDIFSTPRGLFWWGIPAAKIPATASPNYDLSIDWVRRQLNELI